MLEAKRQEREGKSLRKLKKKKQGRSKDLSDDLR